MCYHKATKVDYDALSEHYNASFDSIHQELEPIHHNLMNLFKKDEVLKTLSIEDTEAIWNQLIQYSAKDSLPKYYSKDELKLMKWWFKTLTGFNEYGINRFHENGFDHLPSPIITAGSPDEFKLFQWGLVPFFAEDETEAAKIRKQTLNCISEEMFQKRSFAPSLKNAQRCLIPVSGCFEWKWLDDEGTIKVPYYITFTDHQIRSLAGLYARRKKPSGEYEYTYTILTTSANPMFGRIHNSKYRMPVFIDKENEKTWLDKSLSQDKVLDLCLPNMDPAMQGYTVSKILTTKNINTNVPEVIARMDYNAAIREADQLLKSGNKKKALEIFKETGVIENAKEEDIKFKTLPEIETDVRLVA
jgi:putative SOS response-associated peptidase YedK